MKSGPKKVGSGKSSEDKEIEKAILESQRVQKILKEYKPKKGKKAKEALPGIAGRRVTVPRQQLKGQVPDEEDKKNITELITTYNLAYPYPHEQSLQAAYEEGIKGTIRDPKKLRKQNKEGAHSLAFHLPLPFALALKEGYPLIFIDPVQFEWFKENFSEWSLLVK